MFESDVLKHAPAIYSYALRMTKHVDQAEDLVQETLFKAISKQGQYKEGTNLRAWMFTICRNVFLSGLRQNRLVSDPDSVITNSLVSESNQEIMIQFKEFEAIFNTMSPEHQRSIQLVLIDGYTYQDAAEMEKVELGTMKSRVSRARKMLTDKLGYVMDDKISNSVRINNDNFRSGYSR